MTTHSIQRFEHRPNTVGTRTDQEDGVNPSRISSTAQSLLTSYQTQQANYQQNLNTWIHTLSSRYTITKMGWSLYTTVTGRVEEAQQTLREQKLALQASAQEVLESLLSNQKFTTVNEIGIFIRTLINPILNSHKELFLTPNQEQQSENLILFAPLLCATIVFSTPLSDIFNNLYTRSFHIDAPPTTIATALGASYDDSGTLVWEEGRLTAIKTRRDERFIDSLSRQHLTEQLAGLQAVRDPSPLMKGRMMWLEKQITTPAETPSRTTSSTTRGMHEAQLKAKITQIFASLEAMDRELQPEIVVHDVTSAIDHGLSQGEVDQLVSLLEVQKQANPEVQEVLEKEIRKLTAASRQCIVSTIQTSMIATIQLEVKLQQAYNCLQRLPDYKEDAELKSRVEHYNLLKRKESPRSVDVEVAYEDSAALQASIPHPPIDPALRARQRQDSNSRTASFLATINPQNAYQRIELIVQVLDLINKESISPTDLAILHSTLCCQWMYLCQVSKMPPDEAAEAQEYIKKHGSRIRDLRRMIKS